MKISVLITAIILSFVSTRGILGQDQFQYRVERFSTEDGLPSNSIHDIQEDSLGFLWMGTLNGLVRYDGYTFKTYLPHQDDSTSISGSHIVALDVDVNGHLWAAGGFQDPAGLNHFDPRNERFSNFRHDPENPNSLIDDEISTIASSPDDPGTLWIGKADWISGQNTGLSRLDVNRGTFYNYTRDDGLKGGIWSLHVDRNGILWAGTWGSGLNRYDPGTNTFSSYLPNPSRAPDDLANAVMSIYEDRDGAIWVGTGGQYGSDGGGLSRFDKDTQTFKSYTPQGRETSAVRAILEDRSGIFWVGTIHGLYTFDRDQGIFTRFEHQPSSSNIWTIYEDRFGAIWVGSSGGGLMKVVQWTNPFTVYKHEPDNMNSLADKVVSSIHEYSDGLLFIITRRWFNWIDRETGIVVRQQAESSRRSNQLPVNPTYVYKDRFGTLWVGFCSSGLSKMDQNQRGLFTRYVHDPDDPDSISEACINNMFEDQSGNFWISTWGGGIDLMDRELETFTNYSTTEGLGDHRVLTIYEAPSEQGILWIGTERGLSQFRTETKEFTNYDIRVLRRSMMIHEDRQGRFWVVTASSGIHLFDRKLQRIQESFTTQDGLSHNEVWSISEDSQGFLWLTTSHGLSKFDPNAKTFRNFYTSDGLPDNSFRERAKYQSTNGELFLGGYDGVVSFFPEDLLSDSKPPEVVLTGLRIKDKQVEIGAESPLKVSMPMIKTLVLSHLENDITFEFVGIHFSSSSQTRYRHRMEGYDEDWVEVGDYRTARYTSLDPGEYVFHVSAKSGETSWEAAEASVFVTILPPWWQTWWMYTIYGLLLICGIIAINRYQRKRLITKERIHADLEKAKAIESTNNELQRALKHLTETQDQLIHTEKMASLGQLTAGIAHEIKNPLNFVNNFSSLSIGIVDELKTWIEEKGGMDVPEVKELVDTLTMNAAKINEHGQRADGIIRSMLEHSRTGRGDCRNVDINKLVDEYVNLAYHGARARAQGLDVNLNRAYDQTTGKIEIYPQEIGRVLINLLDNAFYTVNEKRLSVNGHYEPQVSVSTKKAGNYIELRIRDNGLGIPKEIRDKIFDPFFTTKPTGSGTGLGLSLSHDIVVKGHGGRLVVESGEENGATFVIALPLTEGKSR